MLRKNIIVENAQIGFRNFSGAAGKFNPAGRRNFCVFFDNKVGNMLADEGWNIRWLDPKDEGEAPRPYLQVAVSYDNIPPTIVLVGKKGKTKLSNESINVLDYAEIENVDLVIRPYNWTANGKSGVKAYVKTMYVTIVEDEFADKYYDTPDSAVDAIGGCGNCETCDGDCQSHGR